MVKSIYITSAEGLAGKSTVALGVLEALLHRVQRVGVFRPISRSSVERDDVLELLLARDSFGTDGQGDALDYEDCIGVTYDEVHADPDAAIERVVRRYKAVEARCDAVVILGSDYTDVGSPTELAYNARIAANLGAPVLLVLGGRSGRGAEERPHHREARTPQELAQLTEVSLGELRQEHARLLAVVANRADPERIDEITAAVSAALEAAPRPRGDSAHPVPVWALPEDPFLAAPSVRSLMEAVGGRLVSGDPELLAREALGVVIGAMSMENVLARLIEGSVVAVPGDRTEVLIAVLVAHQAATFPSISGLVLHGGFELSEQVERLIEGLKPTLPIIQSDLTTYDMAARVSRTRGRLTVDSRRKEDTALSLFDRCVDQKALLDLLEVDRSRVVTPTMFEFGLLERARANRRHIVLPEGDDDRVLRAAGTILTRGVADLTILGEEIEVRSRAIGLGIDISAAQVVSPFDDVLRFKFAREYARLRAGKGADPTVDQASDTITDVAYFGAMMVHMGLADGMVSGLQHTAAHTMRPAFEVLGARDEVSSVSGALLLALPDRVLLYADCAIIPNPSAGQLADIAVASASTARVFGIEPRIALLASSADGTVGDVDKMREAAELLRERDPGLAFEGPLRYDAARDASVFVFPDLNAASNTYRALASSGGARSFGPFAQGLTHPVNDVSRDSSVEDVVISVALTAVQAAHS